MTTEKKTEKITPMPSAVDVRGASTITGFSVQTLNAWRVKGGGSPFVKAHRAVRYRLADLEKWMADRVVSSTAEVAANRAAAARV